MSTNAPQASTDTVYVEAAAWVVRLHGPNRSRAVEAGLRRWLAEHPDHQQAFELATDTWNAANVRAVATPGGFRWKTAMAAAAGAAAVAVLVGLVSWMRPAEMVTQIGEQRTLRLEDGTQVSLNTNTRLLVEYDKSVRRVRLEQGEVRFDVARRSDRPFVVVAGDKTVTALGTAFVVRRQADLLSVTLVEGKVAVERQGNSDAPEVLSPGQRLTFSAAATTPLVDEPQLEQVTGWQRGVVMLEETALTDAIAEMNRYSTEELVIEDPSVAGLQVSGIFRAGDSRRFARAVAKTYQLIVVEQPGRIVLAGAGVN